MAYFQSIEEERSRRIQARTEEDPLALQQWEAALSKIETEENRKKLKHAFDYAKGMSFHHPGLSFLGYFNHCLRVSGICLTLYPQGEAEVGVVGLFHNFLEVTNVDLNELSARFNIPLKKSLEILTVDRSRQWDPDYQKKYYEGIYQSGPLLRIVKVIDKFDNLFLLGLNADEKVRQKYLEDIEKYILPIVISDLPEIRDYFVGLTRDCSKRGYFGNELEIIKT